MMPRSGKNFSLRDNKVAGVDKQVVCDSNYGPVWHYYSPKVNLDGTLKLNSNGKLEAARVECYI